jgi:AhpD family alkylhydroperoxidase
MNRKEVYMDIKETLGLIPAIFKCLPDATLEEEWHLFKSIRLDTGMVPNKYRELIGLSIAAATNCRLSAIMHAELARAAGATDDEIEEALHFAKLCMGWNTYMAGTDIDPENLRNEMRQVSAYLRTSEVQHLLHRAQAEAYAKDTEKLSGSARSPDDKFALH